ncbi:hypothetical protein JXA80_09870 [bacterium]|nr:hypothetical protein [candidate division CSSED10-310 bacterium]
MNWLPSYRIRRAGKRITRMRCAKNPSVSMRFVAWILLAGVTMTGCTVRKMMSGTINNLTQAVFRQRDPQLAREGSASFLLVIDGLIQGNPQDGDLLLHGVQMYTAYAGAFALSQDPERAFILYDQALDYGFRLWHRYFGWTDIRRMDIDTYRDVISQCGPADVPALYWTAFAWSGWISVHPESTLAIADLSYVVEAMKRVLVLNDHYQSGAVHLFFGMYYAIQPAGMGRDLNRSRDHFDAAMILAGPEAMLPKVLFARYYARAIVDEQLFVNTLEEVIHSPSSCPVPELNLQNAIAREQARIYLDRVHELF